MIIVEIKRTTLIKDKDIKSKRKETLRSIEEVLNKANESKKAELEYKT
jgi:hypothetical protein